jgi:hypothetical protein
MTINLDQYTNTLNVTDTATNADLNVTTKGTGVVNLNTGSGAQARIIDIGDGTRPLQINGGSAAGAQIPGITATAVLAISAGGGNPIRFYTNGRVTTQQAEIAHTASAVNYVELTGAPTNNAPTIGSRGSDTNINFAYSSKGTGGHDFYTAGTSFARQLTVAHTASAVNYVQLTGGVTGGNVQISAQGTDSSTGISLVSKGGGGSVWKGDGGVYFQNNAANNLFSVENTSSTVNRLTATGSVTGSGPRLFAQGSDTNIDINLTTKGTGAVRFNTGGGLGFRVSEAFLTGTAVNYIDASGRQTGLGPVLSVNGSDTNVRFNITSKGSEAVGIYTNLANQLQFNVTHTASAVNYVQVTGSATGVAVQLSAQGSDTNISLVLQPKGTGALQAQQTDSTATGGNARGANAVDFQMVRSAAGQVASGPYAVISGGVQNTSSSNYSVVCGGTGNTASGGASVVIGGQNSTAGATYSVAGGGGNVATGNYSIALGGYGITSAGFFSTILGGQQNSATSGSTVTTQSATMNGTTAVTLSGSNASIKVGQYVSGTYVAGLTYVAAVSGTSLTLSFAASGSGTATLSFYTPHGVVVGGGNNTATGSYSFIGGGGDAGTAGNRNVASGDWSTVAGGFKNTASGLYSSIAGGFTNTASGSNSFVSGTSSTASGSVSAVIGSNQSSATNFDAVVVGGQVNTASGIDSGVFAGAYGITRGLTGATVFPASTAPITTTQGVSQSALLVLGRQTTDATPTVLCSNSVAASTTNQIILPNNSAYFFTGEVVAGVTGGGNTKGWTIEGVIKRGANAASTALVGTPTVTSTYADAGASTWVIAVTADTTNGGLAVTFTGQASTTIRTVAKISTVEMTF